MELHGKPTDPYRIFFPLGIVLGAMGVSIWPLYYFGITDGYSGRAHAFVQTDGFLYSFIAGFLLTAIPRFTGTEPPSRRVQCVLAAIVAGSAIAFEFQQFAVGQTGFVIAHAFLITLAARRFRRRRLDPPDTFVLAGLGLMCGALGALINAGIALNFIRPLWDPLGKRALTEGMVLDFQPLHSCELPPRARSFCSLCSPGGFRPCGRRSPGAYGRRTGLSSLLCGWSR